MSLLEQAAFALEEGAGRNNQQVLLLARRTDRALRCCASEMANWVQLVDEVGPVGIAQRRMRRVH